MNPTTLEQTTAVGRGLLLPNHHEEIDAAPSRSLACRGGVITSRMRRDAIASLMFIKHPRAAMWLFWSIVTAGRSGHGGSKVGFHGGGGRSGGGGARGGW